MGGKSGSGEEEKVGGKEEEEEGEEEEELIPLPPILATPGGVGCSLLVLPQPLVHSSSTALPTLWCLSH